MSGLPFENSSAIKPGVSAEELLHSVFGYEAFRLEQKQIIENVLAKRDTLVIMPTGGGKSLCYQIPALIFEGLTVVVSPLISLMQDQVSQLSQLGVSAVCLNSSLGLDEYEMNLLELRSGKVKLLYLAPETLFLERTQRLLGQVRVDCLTIDEAHCISDWGHDFRPEYRKLLEIRRKLKGVVTIALTATATARVRDDIREQLAITEGNEFIASFDRPNLHLNVLAKENVRSQVLGILRQHADESGIIYCYSRNQVDELAAFLAGRGFSVRPYHAGLADDMRAKNQRMFIRDDVQIIVATVAFGMGINKPNVRFVIHHDLPKNMESYYQEIGRAGRDGLKADCYLLYSHCDTNKIKYFIAQKDEEEKRVALAQLATLVNYAESEVCRRQTLLQYFGETTGEYCGTCDVCLNPPKDKVDLTVPAQKFLSCVKRTGERFGAAYVIEVLRGAKTQKVLANGHETLSTYGIGRELEKTEWLALSRQLVQQGLLRQDAEYGTLALAPPAIPLLKGETKFLGLLRVKTPPPPLIKGRGAAGGVGSAALFEILRRKRKELADEQNLAPYMIFSDKSLIDMSTRLPRNRAEFLDMHGVGEVKWHRYGEQFLYLIREFAGNR